MLEPQEKPHLERLSHAPHIYKVIYGRKRITKAVLVDNEIVKEQEKREAREHLCRINMKKTQHRDERSRTRSAQSMRAAETEE